MSAATATLDAFLNHLGGVSTPFSIELPSGEKRNIGQGAMTGPSERCVLSTKAISPRPICKVTSTLRAKC
jgi:hypothetical protein